MLRDQEAANQHAMASAAALRLPVIASNGVSHATPAERELMDVLTCIRQKTAIQQAGRLLARNDQRHLKPPPEMASVFRDTPGAIANTVQLADRVQFQLDDLGYRFPCYPVPAGETMNSFLRQRTAEGAIRRYGLNHPRAYRQIARELDLIEKLDLAGYFLIVWDIVEFCRREGILVQGRGSAANSAVCYSLGITAVDPVGMDLLFERFLSEERGEWPDIDLDLASGEQRERAIQYVYQRYGSRGAAMTANVITYCTRSAIRDVGKALGFGPDMLSRLSKLAGRGGFERECEQAEKPRGGQTTCYGEKRPYPMPPQHPLRASQRFEQAGLALSHPLVAKFFSLSQSILDLPRHLGQHSGGMVICEGELDTVVPLQPASMPGRVIVQWDKEDCAAMGIIKVDLLGLGMMALLKDAVDLIRTHYKQEVSLAHLPQDDPAVYSALQRADTVGLFQVESRAQMSCLPRLKPRCFYDIVVQVAIIRPGPIVGKMLHPYLRRRQGLEPATCLHPLLEPVLARTLGVPLFQEQLLRMAMIVAGFTGGEAEELRRAMGFKRSQKRMAEIETRLRSGMEQKGITGDVQDTIVQAITAFALYGFPESHAASFALIAYASAYLKCHYLAAFTAAILNNQPMGFYNAQTLVKDAQRHGLRFLPVDVTRSEWLCTIEDVAGELRVRLGMNYVKGMRESTAQSIAANRPFASLEDLTRRTGIGKEELTALAELGALNFIGGSPADTPVRHRRDALWEAELAGRPVTDLLLQAVPEAPPSPLLPMQQEERLVADYRNSGLTIGAHPLRHHRPLLDRLRVVPAANVKNFQDGRPVRVAGAVICRQQPATAKGFVFLSLEDETGIVNVILRPQVFERVRAVVVTEPYLIVDGVLQNQSGVVSVKAGGVRSMLERPAVAAESHDFG
jgi:error-prone DNA polymerase